MKEARKLLIEVKLNTNRNRIGDARDRVFCEIETFAWEGLYKKRAVGYIRKWE